MEFNKKTGYKVADSLGYNGKKFDSYCYQRKLRDKYLTFITLPLEGSIKPIDFKTAQEFILKYEWLGTMGTTKHSVGYFVGDELVAVFCFGLTAGTKVTSEPFGEEFKSKGIVLVRGACSPQAHKHTASHAIPQALKYVNEKYGYLFCIAYSDPEAGEIGTVYQATNWLFYGLTSRVTYLIRPDGKKSDPKLIHKYAKKNNRTTQEQKQIFLDEGYRFERGYPKLKYLKTMGNKRERKNLIKHAKFKSFPYLKREENMIKVYDNFDKKKGVSL